MEEKVDYDKYILLDYESFLDVNIDIIDERTKLIIIVHEKQNVIPADFIKIIQSFGNSIELLQIDKTADKMAFYYFIVYYLGYYISKYDDKEFIIFSYDENCRPLIEYLQNKNINVKLVEKTQQNNLNKPSKNIFCRVLTFFKKLSIVKRIVLTCIFFLIIGLVTLLSISLQPDLVPIIDAPIRDKEALERVVQRLNQEGVKIIVNPEGLIQVNDEDTARRMRAILISENLIPLGVDPWQVFARDRWTYTDFERNINRQQDQRRMIIEHIKAIDDIDNADLIVAWPRRELFQSDEKPVMVSLIITPRHNSDIVSSAKIIDLIQKILRLSIPGLEDENIFILDNNGIVLNSIETLQRNMSIE